jgi:hypothetical protein
MSRHAAWAYSIWLRICSLLLERTAAELRSRNLSLRLENDWHAHILVRNFSCHRQVFIKICQLSFLSRYILENILR